MRAYPDSSIIVSAFVEEISSTIAEVWLTTIAPDDLMISAWCETEAAGALSAKTRAGMMTAAERQQLLGLIRDLFRDSASLIPIERRHFVSAANLITQCSKPLRSGDALHLAIASDVGATLWTLDKRMAEAGQALALDVRLLG